jgi:hypothetical protein
MKKIVSTIPVVALLLFIGTGCKQQRDFLADAKAGSTDAVGFGFSNAGASVFSLDASTTTFKQALNAYLSAQKTYGQAISVTVEANSSIVDDYNAQKGTSFEVMPSDVYTLPSTINIPANSKEGLGEIDFDIPTMLTHGTAFALGVEITQVSGGPNKVMTDHSKHVFIIQVKNEWDGKYNIHVNISGPNSYTGTDFSEDGYPLSTLNANSVTAPYIADFFSGYEQLTFNNDGTVTVLAGGDATDPNGYGAVMIESSYDATDHSIHVKYSILGGKYIFDETYTRQ